MPGELPFAASAGGMDEAPGNPDAFARRVRNAPAFSFRVPWVTGILVVDIDNILDSHDMSPMA